MLLEAPVVSVSRREELPAPIVILESGMYLPANCKGSSSGSAVTKARSTAPGRRLRAGPWPNLSNASMQGFLRQNRTRLFTL